MNLTARPQMLKQVNLSLIRNAFKSIGIATRAEIADKTMISPTTVRSLMTEMQRNGEIESIGYAESSGGRKAERYRFKSNRFFSVSFCITSDAVHYLIVDIYGNTLEAGELGKLDVDTREPIVSFLDQLLTQREIKSIGLGVPGIVDDGVYWSMAPDGDSLTRIDIGVFLAQLYGIPVIMENDLNAIAIGYCRSYEKQYPAGSPDSGSDGSPGSSSDGGPGSGPDSSSDSASDIDPDSGSDNSPESGPAGGPGSTNMAYISFAEHGISAGFIAGGKIVRGFKNHAGELSLVPHCQYDTPYEFAPAKMDDDQFFAYVVKVLSWICAILNPQYITLAGPEFRENCLAAIRDGIRARISHNMLPEVHYSADARNNYFEGMAFLTAERIFDEVHLRKM